MLVIALICTHIAASIAGGIFLPPLYTKLSTWFKAQDFNPFNN